MLCPANARVQGPRPSDHLEHLPFPLIAIYREGELLVVGKFAPLALEEILKPGDILEKEDGCRIEYVGVQAAGAATAP